MAETFREFVGGPCAGQCRVVSDTDCDVSVYMPEEEWADPAVPEVAVYRLCADGQFHCKQIRAMLPRRDRH